MNDRKQATEVRGDESRTSAPADEKKDDIRGVAQRDNVKGKTHNSQTRKDEDDG